MHVKTWYCRKGSAVLGNLCVVWVDIKCQSYCCHALWFCRQLELLVGLLKLHSKPTNAWENNPQLAHYFLGTGCMNFGGLRKFWGSDDHENCVLSEAVILATGEGEEEAFVV